VPAARNTDHSGHINAVCRRAASALPALCCWLLAALAAAARGVAEIACHCAPPKRCAAARTDARRSHKPRAVLYEHSGRSRARACARSTSDRRSCPIRSSVQLRSTRRCGPPAAAASADGQGRRQDARRGRARASRSARRARRTCRARRACGA
jgi:hypothetical protein